MIEIVTYRASWPNEFKTIAANLRHALGGLALRIDHIGSTSVPGLAAKDRIDIQITVMSLEPAVEQALNQIGYTRLEYTRDHVPPGSEASPGDWVKWFFKPSEGQQPMNLHVRVDGRANQRYALLFRDYLRTHPATAQAYADLKRRLAKSLADPDIYPEVKDQAIDLIYLAAEDWASATNWQPVPSDV